MRKLLAVVGTLLMASGVVAGTALGGIWLLWAIGGSASGAVLLAYGLGTEERGQ